MILYLYHSKIFQIKNFSHRILKNGFPVNYNLVVSLSEGYGIFLNLISKPNELLSSLAAQHFIDIHLLNFLHPIKLNRRHICLLYDLRPPMSVSSY